MELAVAASHVDAGCIHANPVCLFEDVDLVVALLCQKMRCRQPSKTGPDDRDPPLLALVRVHRVLAKRFNELEVVKAETFVEMSRRGKLERSRGEASYRYKRLLLAPSNLTMQTATRQCIRRSCAARRFASTSSTASSNDAPDLRYEQCNR